MPAGASAMPALGARLLTTADEAEAAAIAADLDRLNRERQTVEAGMLEEALAEAEQALGQAGPGRTPPPPSSPPRQAGIRASSAWSRRA